MKHDLTPGTWQDDTGDPISIILAATSDEGIKTPAGQILPRICTLLNGAAAPSPVRIGPHPITTMSIMVLQWGGCGGFALLHP